MFYGTLTNATVAASSAYSFNVSDLLGTTLGYSNGTFTFNAPGIYRLHFDATVTGTSSTAGSATTALYVNGTQYKTALATSTVDDTADNVISFETIVKVGKACGNSKVTAQVVQLTNPVSVVNANFVVTRIA